MKFKEGDMVVPWKLFVSKQPGRSSSKGKKKLFNIPAIITSINESEKHYNTWNISLSFPYKKLEDFAWREEELRKAYRKDIKRHEQMLIEKNI